MIRVYTKEDMEKAVGKYHTVAQLWLNQEIKKSIKIDEKLVDLLDKMADHFGKPVHLGSPNALYRTTATNKACGGAPGSKHVNGQGADFSIESVEPLQLAQYAEKIGAGGIGMYRGTRYIHMDTRGYRTCWWLITSNSNTPGFGGVPMSFKFGHRSPAIIAIQEKLEVEGYDCGIIDGKIGIRTTTALQAYQREHDLKDDGVFGRKTNDSMQLFEW